MISYQWYLSPDQPFNKKELFKLQYCLYAAGIYLDLSWKDGSPVMTISVPEQAPEDKSGLITFLPVTADPVMTPLRVSIQRLQPTNGDVLPSYRNMISLSAVCSISVLWASLSKRSRKRSAFPKELFTGDGRRLKSLALILTPLSASGYVLKVDVPKITDFWHTGEFWHT